MRILHIINHLEMGGAQSQLVELAPVQKAMGHEVMVLELKAAQDRTIANRLIDSSVKVEALSKTRSVRNPVNILSIMPYFREFDIVHAHLFPANYWTALAKMISLSHTPIITTEHSTENKRRKIAIFRFIDSFIYRRYCEVVACADKALETFKLRYPTIDCISISNGINVSRYTQAEPYSKQELLNVSGNTCLVTMVARFDYPKRQDTLVGAIEKLPDKYHAIFVGGTLEHPGLQKIKVLAIEKGVQSRVHFLYTRADVPRILKTSDIVVLASEYEGLSLSSIEGMACGRPFIATDVNGLREVVDGAGELFACGDADALARLIERISEDEQYYNMLAERCLLRAKKYDIYDVVKKYQQEYNKFVYL